MQAHTAINGSGLPTAAAIMMKGAAAMPCQSATIAKPVSPARALSKGEELFAEGDVADFFYKVVSGTVRTYKLLSDGRRQIDAFHLAGDIFGLETGEEHRFSADAVDAATVVAYRRRRFETLAHDDHPSDGELVALARKFFQANDRMKSPA